MTPDEAKRLLGHAAAFDNRQPSGLAAHAWAAALQDVPLDSDALNAIAAYYGADGEPTEKRWLQPHHVRHYRNLARRERITAANALYDGKPDESGLESAQSIRALTDAAASGQMPARPIRAALEPGERPAVSGRAKAMLETVGQHVPSPRAGVVNVLAIGCPICSSPAGKTCQSRRKKHRADVHPARLEDAKRIAAGQPPVDRSQVAVEEQQRMDAARRALELSGPTAFVPPTRDEAEPKTADAS